MNARETSHGLNILAAVMKAANRHSMDFAHCPRCGTKLPMPNPPRCPKWRCDMTFGR